MPAGSQVVVDLATVSTAADFALTVTPLPGSGPVLRGPVGAPRRRRRGPDAHDRAGRARAVHRRRAAGGGRPVGRPAAGRVDLDRSGAVGVVVVAVGVHVVRRQPEQVGHRVHHRRRAPGPRGPAAPRARASTGRRCTTMPGRPVQRWRARPGTAAPRRPSAGGTSSTTTSTLLQRGRPSGRETRSTASRTRSSNCAARLRAAGSPAGSSGPRRPRPRRSRLRGLVRGTVGHGGSLGRRAGRRRNARPRPACRSLPFAP